MTKTNKCTKGRLCAKLIAAIDDGGGKGIKAHYGVTSEMMDAGQFRLEDMPIIAVSYKTCAKDKGRLFNFCPFCGERFSWARG